MINAASIKAIIVDLDKTLLHTDKTLSAHTAKVLKDCKRCGIKIMVATARPLRATKQYSDLIDFDAMVVSNGARIIYRNQRTDYRINQRTAEHLFNSLKKHSNLRITLETGDCAYTMIIIPYEEKYRDDLIFMVLQAKDALGRKPTINADLLDIQSNYLDRGNMFWIAINEDDRVIGCIGYSKIEHSSEAFLHRLFVKASEKHKGIGTKLLQTVENEMRKQGIAVSHVHLGEPKEQWFESYEFYPKNGYREYKPRYMRKTL